MNLPLPSASTSVAPDSTRYSSVAASSSRPDARDDETDFADLLAGATLSAGSNPFQRSAGASSSPTKTDDQVPAAQTPNGPATKQAGPAKRAQLKTDRSDSAGAAAQSNAGPSPLLSLPAVDASPMPAQTAGSASAGECDETPPPADVADSIRQLPPFLADLHPMSWRPSGVSTDQNGADPQSGTAAILPVTDAIGNPAATAREGSTVPDIDLESGHELASAKAPAAPVGPGIPQAAPRHPAAGALPGPSTISQDDLTVAPSGGPSANGMESHSDWAEKFASPAMPPTPNQPSGAASIPSDPASDARLSPDFQQVKISSHSVGIASAEQSTEMRKLTDTSAPAGLDRASGPEVSAPSAVSPAFSSSPTIAPVTRAISEPALTPVSHAAAAVEATLDAVEHMRDTTHSSVELQLSFSDDAHLAVRVEMRNGEVQTTFRTDSTELRQALTSEWRQQAPTVTTDGADRPVRIADPVFTPESGSLGSAGTSTGGHANSRQPSIPAPAPSSFSTSARAQAQASPASPLPPGPSRLPSSLRLNVFA